MIQLIYMSTATKEMNESDLIALLAKSWEKNERLDITGLLLFKNGLFLHMLEGPEKAVDELYETICADKRNTGNVLIERKSIDNREFPDWRMGFQNISHLDLGKLSAHTVILNPKLPPEQIAKHKDSAIKLILGFKDAGRRGD